MSNIHYQRDFLLEIGTEELPPKALSQLNYALGENLKQQLAGADLTHGEIELFATPRRLAVLIKNLISKQPNKMVEQRGPHVSVAFNLDGTPTIACQRFAETNGVKIAELGRVKDARGNYVMAKKVRVGEIAQNLLPELVNKALKTLPIPRQMRWGRGVISFARPVHWIVMIYGEEIVAGTILGVAASNKTYGHRFHAPQAITITTPRQYKELLRTAGYVIANAAQRKTLITAQANSAASAINTDSFYGTVVIDEDVLDEITSITEWPVALCGNFAARFLRLPREVLLLVLQKQQRCFPIVDIHNNLTGHFIAISNIKSKRPGCVIEGNERVVLARLTDADFFYRSDIQLPLTEHFEQLQKTVFQANLGSMFDKTLRLKEIASYVANLIGADVAATVRAAELSKSDLITTMVGEFPELQGIMGYYYALHAGESQKTAMALREQYLPNFAKDVLPQTLEGAALAIADRIDNIVGIFSLGKVPTGERDPYGLRRAVFGVLRILLEKNLDIDVLDLVRRAMRQYLEQIEKFDELLVKNYESPSEEGEESLEEIAARAINKIMEFIFERQRSWYTEAGVASVVFEAVRMRKPLVTRPIDFAKRLYAVQYFLTLEEAQALSAAHKRVKNILADAAAKGENVFVDAAKKLNTEKSENVATAIMLELNHKLLKEEAEKELAAKLMQVTQLVVAFCAKAKYQEALQEMATLKSSVDYFFNTAMVMVDDKKLRHNRLILLQLLQNLFYSVADIAYLNRV